MIRGVNFEKGEQVVLYKPAKKPGKAKEFAGSDGDMTLERLGR